LADARPDRLCARVDRDLFRSRRLDHNSEKIKDNGRTVRIVDRAIAGIRLRKRERRKAVPTWGGAPVMKIWARALYIATFLLMATLPFNPLLNQRFVVFPVSVICVALGLFAMYFCTLPGHRGHAGEDGGR
jgi:hypothetical protein